MFYRYLKYKGHDLLASRVAWILHYGEWPVGRISPIDGDTLNVAISNLRQSNSVAKEFKDNAGYMKSHREQNPLFWKDLHLQRNFGISLEEYHEMIGKQGNRCAICGESETAERNGKKLALAVDHDHKTGKIRELLQIAPKAHR